MDEAPGGPAGMCAAKDERPHTEKKAGAFNVPHPHWHGGMARGKTTTPPLTLKAPRASLNGLSALIGKHNARLPQRPTMYSATYFDTRCCRKRKKFCLKLRQRKREAPARKFTIQLPKVASVRSLRDQPGSFALCQSQLLMSKSVAFVDGGRYGLASQLETLSASVEGVFTGGSRLPDTMPPQFGWLSVYTLGEAARFLQDAPFARIYSQPLFPAAWWRALSSIHSHVE